MVWRSHRSNTRETHFFQPQKWPIQHIFFPMLLMPITLSLSSNFDFSTKLTVKNYLAWKLQVEALLNGYDPIKFIDGSHPCPLATIFNNAKPLVIMPNPAHRTWIRQDRLLYGALEECSGVLLIVQFWESVHSPKIWGIFSPTPELQRILGTRLLKHSPTPLTDISNN